MIKWIVGMAVITLALAGWAVASVVTTELHPYSGTVTTVVNGNGKKAITVVQSYSGTITDQDTTPDPVTVTVTGESTTTEPPTTTTEPPTTTTTPPTTGTVPCGSDLNAFTSGATAGGVYQLGACVYPSVDFRTRKEITFVGQTGTVLGDVDSHGGQHITLKNLNLRSTFLVPENGSSGGVNSADLHFDGVNMTAGGIFLRGCQNCTFRNGSSGNTTDAYSQTIGAYSSANPSRDILIEDWRFHDMNRSTNPAGHMECLFIQEAVNVTLRRTRFERCEVFDLYISDLFGGPISGISVQDSRFDATTPTGYYAIEVNFNTNVEFLRNSFGQGVYVQEGSVSGCGNTADGSSSVTPPSLLQPC